MLAMIFALLMANPAVPNCTYPDDVFVVPSQSLCKYQPPPNDTYNEPFIVIVTEQDTVLYFYQDRVE